MSLRELRTRFNLTQGEFARLVGVKQSVYNAWENLSAKDIDKIAYLCKVDPCDIEVPYEMKEIQSDV